MTTWEAATGGARLGGLVGGLFGPEGVPVGAVIGAGVGIVALAVAVKVAKDKLKAGEQAKTCASCAKEIPCFKMPKKGTPEEMDRQLQEQEDKINSMKPEDLEKNIEDFQTNGRGAGDATNRQNARNLAERMKTSELKNQYMADGMSEEDASTKAAADAEDYMNGVDATHSLDMSAGGDGTLTGVGGSAENRSIGSQWSKPSPGSDTSRAEDLKQAATDQKGQKKMNVKLKRCK